MNNLSGPIIVEEVATHLVMGVKERFSGAMVAPLKQRCDSSNSNYLQCGRGFA
jgi:hypothetical protein